MLCLETHPLYSRLFHPQLMPTGFLRQRIDRYRPRSDAPRTRPQDVCGCENFCRGRSRSGYLPRAPPVSLARSFLPLPSPPRFQPTRTIQLPSLSAVGAAIEIKAGDDLRTVSRRSEGSLVAAHLRRVKRSDLGRVLISLTPRSRQNRSCPRRCSIGCAPLAAGCCSGGGGLQEQRHNSWRGKCLSVQLL